MIALMSALFTALTFIGAQNAHGVQHVPHHSVSRDSEVARNHGKSFLHSTEQANRMQSKSKTHFNSEIHRPHTPNQKLRKLKHSKHKHSKVHKPHNLKHSKVHKPHNHSTKHSFLRQFELRMKHKLPFWKRMAALRKWKALVASKEAKKPGRTKIYRPNNRSGELMAHRKDPFYQRMTALKKAKGFVGKRETGLSFHLGRHTKEGCGEKWDLGCVDAAACYTSVNDWGCCWEGFGHMDTEGACAPCAEALGFCDECYADSSCKAEGDNATLADADDAAESETAGGDDQVAAGGDNASGWDDWGDEYGWDEGDWDSSPTEWEVQDMTEEEMQEAFDEGGVDPSSIENACGSKWDFGCSDAWFCYDVMEDHGCCDTKSDPAEMYLKDDCTACAQVVGVCDDCFPMSQCGLKRDLTTEETETEAAATTEAAAANDTETAEAGDATTAAAAVGSNGKCLISDPAWTCIGSQCIPQEDYEWYSAYGGDWCLTPESEGWWLCSEADADWCEGECHCPGNCQHACGRCPDPNAAAAVETAAEEKETADDAAEDKEPEKEEAAEDKEPEKEEAAEDKEPEKEEAAEDKEPENEEAADDESAAADEADDTMSAADAEAHYDGMDENEDGVVSKDEFTDAATSSFSQLSTHSASTELPNGGQMNMVRHRKLRKSEMIHHSDHTKQHKGMVIYHAKKPKKRQKRSNRKSSSGTRYGDPLCPCIGFDKVEGKRMVRLDNTTMADYPVDFGASCQRWDDGRNFLGCMPGQDPGKGEGWCAQKWCYVDPCNCHIKTLPKTSPYLPGATFQGKNIYYSYATCGGHDTFTATRKEACVNQMKEKDCKALTKCAWANGQCMGKDLVGVCKKKLDSVTYGDQKCRCIGIEHLLGEISVNAEKSFLQIPAGQLADIKFPAKVTKFPADAGATCQAWDDGRHPECVSKNETERPEWCTQKWCYVDPCTCDMDVPPKQSKYLPGAVFQGIPVYYSYSTCGSVDTWTLGHHKNACVNQKSKEACVKQDTCDWVGTKCLGKELVTDCPAIAEREKAKSHSNAIALTLSAICLLLISL